MDQGETGGDGCRSGGDGRRRVKADSGAPLQRSGSVHLRRIYIYIYMYLYENMYIYM